MMMMMKRRNSFRWRKNDFIFKLYNKSTNIFYIYNEIIFEDKIGFSLIN